MPVAHPPAPVPGDAPAAPPPVRRHAVPPPLRCVGLTKRWGAAVGVEDLDLEVAAGSVTGFLGANGAGKSTTIKLVAGLLRPTRGHVLLAGRPAAEPAARAGLGYMPADPAFSPRLSGTRNLDLLAALHGRGAPDRAWATDLLGLSPADLRRPVGDYSSGMVQKLALVQAVQHRPELVLLDEPANRLDPLAHRRFEELVRTVAARGGTVVLSSHTLSEVEDLCDDVALVRAGRLLAHRPVSGLAGLAARTVVARLTGPPALLPASLAGARVEGGTVTLQLPRGSLDAVRALAARDDLEDLTITPASLEDAFLAFYADAGADADARGAAR